MGCTRMGLRGVLVVGVLVLGWRAQAADVERGQMLYENHCRGCHDSVVHIREAHKATSVDEVRHQVARFAQFLELGWEERDITDVARYLDRRYYRFEESTRTQ